MESSVIHQSNNNHQRRDLNRKHPKIRALSTLLRVKEEFLVSQQLQHLWNLASQSFRHFALEKYHPDLISQ